MGPVNVYNTDFSPSRQVQTLPSNHVKWESDSCPTMKKMTTTTMTTTTMTTPTTDSIAEVDKGNNVISITEATAKLGNVPNQVQSSDDNLGQHPAT